MTLSVTAMGLLTVSALLAACGSPSPDPGETHTTLQSSAVALAFPRADTSGGVPAVNLTGTIHVTVSGTKACTTLTTEQGTNVIAFGSGWVLTQDQGVASLTFPGSKVTLISGAEVGPSQIGGGLVQPTVVTDWGGCDPGTSVFVAGEPVSAILK